ncbi:hypothetical protein [Pseudomonas cavernicola]|uniref:hypothetical protein n=1 Tax=Pseudomonas cavernicola TaxID=2320866 RepID=UPI0011C39D43|nr:hypothetical protein [Pseudomonas cavernicola]
MPEEYAAAIADLGGDALLCEIIGGREDIHSAVKRIRKPTPAYLVLSKNFAARSKGKVAKDNAGSIG